MVVGLEREDEVSELLGDLLFVLFFARWWNSLAMQVDCSALCLAWESNQAGTDDGRAKQIVNELVAEVIVFEGDCSCGSICLLWNYRHGRGRG